MSSKSEKVGTINSKCLVFYNNSPSNNVESLIHKQKNSHLSIISHDHKRFFLRLLGNFSFAVLLIAFFPLVSKAMSINAQTNKVVEGRESGLVLYSESTPLTTVDELLSFTLIDGETEIKITPNTQDNILLDSTKTIKEQVRTLLSATSVTEADLHTLPDSIVNIIDEDGDANPINRASEIKGRIKVQWFDKDDELLSSSAVNGFPDICHAPYKLKLEVDNVQAKTTYGFPQESSIFTGSKTYLAEIKNSRATFCYAQPALTPHMTMINPDGDVVPPVSVWNPKYGFTVQDNDIASKNFPSTGFTGAWFYLIASGIDDIGQIKDWKVIKKGSSGNMNIKLERAGVDRLKVTFLEPNWSISKGNFQPTEYEITNNPKDLTKKLSYKFNVQTWFSFDATVMNEVEAEEYCQLKGTEIAGKPQWKTFQLRGFEPYKIAEPYPYTPNEYTYSYRLRAIGQGVKKGSPWLNEWGSTILSSTNMRSKLIEARQDYSSYGFLVESHGVGYPSRPKGAGTKLELGGYGTWSSGLVSANEDVGKNIDYNNMLKFEIDNPFLTDLSYLISRGCESQ